MPVVDEPCDERSFRNGGGVGSSRSVALTLTPPPTGRQRRGSGKSQGDAAIARPARQALMAALHGHALVYIHVIRYASSAIVVHVPRHKRAGSSVRVTTFT